MRKRKVILGLTATIIISFLLVIFNLSYILPWELDIKWEQKARNEQEDLLYTFIEKKLMEDNYGIFTNYKEDKSEGDITKGHDVLSESEGLIMLYAVNSGDRELFNKHLKIVNAMAVNNGLIAWRKNKNANAESSATIDDFRVIKALAFAYDRWGDFEYRKQAVNLSRSILKNSKTGNRIIDFSDGFGGKGEDTTICYLDLYTMKILSKIDFRWNNIYKDSLKLIEKSKISKEIPLYYKNYDNKLQKFEDTSNVELLLSMIVILNKSEVGEDVSDSLTWIKQNLKDDGALYVNYDTKTGEATSNVQSTSIYAVGALIAKQSNDIELFNEMIKQLEKFQVKNTQSEIYGSFGDEETNEVFSFDNLNALLALQKK